MQLRVYYRCYPSPDLKRLDINYASSEVRLRSVVAGQIVLLPDEVTCGSLSVSWSSDWPAGPKPLDPSCGCVDRLRFCCRRFPPVERAVRICTSLTLKNATMKGCFSNAPSRPTSPASLELMLCPVPKDTACFKARSRVILFTGWAPLYVMLLTAAGLHTDLQAQVVDRAHHPQITGGSDVKLQPALLSCPQPARVQQKKVCLPRRTLMTSLNHS